jgi:hypothetical protein
VRRARELNAKGPRVVLKVRLLSGIHAPDWAKRLGGAPFGVTDPASGRGGTVGRFWTAEFGAAYAQLQGKLAALYDGVPEIAEVTVSRCTTVFDEPFLREISSPDAPNAYLAAGYTVAADQRCQREEIDAHRVWRRTRSGVAFNPYQFIAADGKARIDEGFTEQMMTYCRTSIGPRCVLENNSIRWPPLTGRYASMYAAMQRLGHPISFQTAAAGRIGDPVQTVVWAAGFGADAVELGAGTSAYTGSQLAELAARWTGDGG